jgi:hypothetical protein
LNWACSENLGGCFGWFVLIVRWYLHVYLSYLYLLTFHYFYSYVYPHNTVRSMFRLAVLNRWLSNILFKINLT